MNVPWGSERRSLWLLTPKPGARPRRITQPLGVSDELPQWSRDGRWLLFVRTRTQRSYIGHGQLYALQPAPAA
jgi:Tol biopolymer transport system component